MANRTIELIPSVLWSALTALAAILGTTAYVTWEIRKDYIDDLKRQIEAYEKSNKWKLPDTLTSIKLASDSLVLNANERKEFNELRKEAAPMREKINKLGSDLNVAMAKLALADLELAKISVPTTIIELNEGDSKFIIENSVNLALLSALSTTSRIRLANIERSISLGETIEYRAGPKNCRLTLLKGTNSSAKFQSACT